MVNDNATNLTARAYQHIRDDILTCRIAPGQKINISDICSQLGFSLGAVREALSRLTSDGLVVAIPNKGFRAAPITHDELEDLTRTRILIECECLSMAIARGDVRWEAGIVSTLFELTRIDLQDPDDPGQVNPTWVDAHRRFHEALVSACGSPWMLRLRETLYIQTERYRSASVPLDRTSRDIAAEHKAIADATIERDTQSALAAMRAHLELTTRILIEADVANLAG